MRNQHPAKIGKRAGGGARASWRRMTRSEKALRAALTGAFEAPPPRGKEAFVQAFRRRERTANIPPRIGTLSFLLAQARYIRWWVWAVSLAVFAGELLFLCAVSANPEGWRMGSEKILMTLGAWMPFAALCVAAEAGRSQAYRMDELEMATRFSLRSVVLARLALIGAVHLGLFGALLGAAGRCVPYGAARTAVYLSVPYLASAFLQLRIARASRGREGLLGCGLCASSVCTLTFLPERYAWVLYRGEVFGVWLLLLAVLAAAAGVLCRNRIKQTEELA